MDSAGSRAHVVFLIEDGPFRFDSRVRREVATLSNAGYSCSVISPAARRDPGHDLPVARVYEYEASTDGGHVREYIHALWWHSRLLKKVAGEESRPEVIHAANPPDLLYLVALPYARRYGTKFVFDQHDLCPELYASRFGDKRRDPMMWALKYFERASYRVANHVIVTNESYREVAITRGGVPSERVTVVRNGPEEGRLGVASDYTPNAPEERAWVGYLGNMNPQDGVDNLIRAVGWLVREKKRPDVHVILVGGGDAVPDLRRLAEELRIGDHVTFTGRLSDADMVATLRKCAVCVQPDPRNALNEVSTMNKVMEYMALGCPVVAYDLRETRVTCGDCASYARRDDAEGLGEAILRVLEDEDLRETLARQGKQRVKEHLAWEKQAPKLLEVYERRLGLG